MFCKSNLVMKKAFFLLSLLGLLGIGLHAQENPVAKTDSILPGESGVIKVKYDTRRVGPIAKAVVVTSNAINSRVVLRIQGAVVVKE